ncbi:MAG: hypothetical protein GQ542_11645 [Desulforhopalus sp.]|jgi:hypothetical protein|nr:hypothetical protein [Desulforhopalus sp.]
MDKRQPNLFSYIVTIDSGFSPNPFGGICTLACSVPSIRRNANLGDWIIGTTPSPERNRLVFAMRVDRGLTFEMYWDFPEYECKKPGKNNGCGDNIYKMGKDGHLVQVKNLFHSKEHFKTDTSINRVLISKTFYYFGKEAVEIPDKLIAVVRKAQGVKTLKPVPKNSDKRDIVPIFLEWLQENFDKGIHGDPTQVKAKCKLPPYESSPNKKQDSTI